MRHQASLSCPIACRSLLGENFYFEYPGEESTDFWSYKDFMDHRKDPKYISEDNNMELCEQFIEKYIINSSDSYASFDRILGDLNQISKHLTGFSMAHPPCY